ncbi:MAG: CxxC-x17-CxxC domain-containing protein, partial [Candidatus Staskawiczbacteria bacterium]
SGANLGIPAPQGGETKLYDAVCSNCGKPTKVIFPPEPGRAVYCKSCLKKMKAGQEIKKPEPKNQEQQNAGISDGSDKNFSRIENISFHNPKRKPEDRQQNKPKRKEINLSELKKALEESLATKEKPEEEEAEAEEETEQGVEGKIEAIPAPKIFANVEEELQSKIEEEKEIDQVKDEPETPEEIAKAKALPSPKTQDNKKAIKPGETVKF